MRETGTPKQRKRFIINYSRFEEVRLFWTRTYMIRVNSPGSIRLQRSVTRHRFAVGANGIDARDRSMSVSRTNDFVRLRGIDKIHGNVAGCVRTLDCWKYCRQEQIARALEHAHELKTRTVGPSRRALSLAWRCGIGSPMGVRKVIIGCRD